MLTATDHFAELTKLGVAHHYKAGVHIFKEGDSGDAVYLLLSGEVMPVSETIDGKAISYGAIQAGQYFGEMALDGGKRSSSVQAITDCECVVIPNALVLAYAQRHSDFALHLLNTAISRARKATDAARDMALLNAYSRLRLALNREFDLGDETCHLSHAQLATQIGASREMVSKLHKDLTRGGYVEAGHRLTTRLKKLPLKW